MDFEPTERQVYWRDRVKGFIETRVRPAVDTYKAQDAEGDRWKVIQIVEDLKAEAKEAGIWNLFMPPKNDSHHHVDDTFEFEGPGLTNLEYALCAEEMGRIGFASEVFNCSAPDTGNMEVFHRYGTRAQKEEWLDDLIINGRKWWSSGLGDPRCKIAIVMGKTTFEGSRHTQQSQVLVPIDTPGVNIIRHLPVFGYDDAPHGHMEVELKDVRVPAANILLGEGRGFEIAQGRLGPGRIHHCMRTIGVAEEALHKMCKRLQEREAFGKPIYKHSVWEERVARARIDIDMTRLLCLKAADMMDKVGNKSAKQEIAMIKVQAPNMALSIIDDAIQAHGGGGVSEDYGLASAYAHQRTLRLADGPDEVHARSIARMELAKHMPEAGPTANALRGDHGMASSTESFSSGDMGATR